jgi:imidazolonepropionase-like amidohydrolase
MDADFLCIVVIVYSVLFMEWETEDTVFHVVSALSWGLCFVDILADMISTNRFGRNSLLVFGLCSPAHRLLVREGIRRTMRRLRRARSRVIFVSDINILYNIQQDSLLASAAY